MARINQNYDKLAAGYLFPEIARRTNAFLESNPGAQVLRLGIGDTTEPIVSSVLDGLKEGVDALGSFESYSGYGPSEGISPLEGWIGQALFGTRTLIRSERIFCQRWGQVRLCKHSGHFL